MKKYKIFLLIIVLSFFCSMIPTYAANGINYSIGTWVKSNGIPDMTIRSAPTTSSSSLTKVLFGTDLKIISEEQAGAGCSDGWYKVVYDGISTGYVCSNYINSKTEITISDATYCNYLTGLGFPSSYCPYLTYLHSIHPNWIFTPSITNLNFSDVVDGEEAKNLINYTIDPYRSSSAPREGSSWFTSSNAVNSYLLDPRNMLMEKSVFMFELLGYNSAYQTREVVKSILGSSSHLYSDDYVNIVMSAADTYNISPSHLASRIVQEGTSNVTNGSVSGTYTGTYLGNSLLGYYNYYNIGSYADANTTSPVSRGLACAAGIICNIDYYGRPWNTRGKSLVGGAEFLASTYITVGQNTLYYQKFNTSPIASYSKYTHQYMTNVTAPLTEGNDTYTSYKNLGLLETTFVFSIPVYLNMPEFTSMPSVANNNSYINSISINSVTLKNFDSDILNYNYVVDLATTSVNLSAVPVNSDTIITGTGDITLTDIVTKVNITATSANGTQKVYTITITRSDDKTTLPEIINKLAVKINSSYLNSLSPGTTAEEIISSIGKISNKSSVSITDANGNIVTSGKLKTNYKINIQSASNEIGNYGIAITGDNNGDGDVTILDLLRTQKHILNSSVLTNGNLVGCDTNDDNKVDILDLLRMRKYILGEIKL